MLKFFRAIRKKLIEQDNVRKYLFYAIGEILLVVIGILIALQVNNWNELRKQQQRESVYLERLNENLHSDKKLFQLNLDFYKQVQSYGETALAYAENGIVQGSNWSVLLAYFQSSQIWPILIESSTYDELKSAGELSLLKSVLLRESLAFYYSGGQFRYNQTIGVNPPYRSLVRKQIPFTVQDYIWEYCHQTDGDKQILTSCAPGVTEEEAAEIINKLKKDKNLTGELRFWMSNIQAGWDILNQQIDVVDLMLAEIQTYNMEYY